MTWPPMSSSQNIGRSRDSRSRSRVFALVTEGRRVTSCRPFFKNRVLYTHGREEPGSSEIDEVHDAVSTLLIE